jgi:hypothetical protein
MLGTVPIVHSMSAILHVDRLIHWHRDGGTTK